MLGFPGYAWIVAGVFSCILANFLSLLALFFALSASNWSVKVFSLAFSTATVGGSSKALH